MKYRSTLLILTIFLCVCFSNSLSLAQETSEPSESFDFMDSIHSAFESTKEWFKKFDYSISYGIGQPSSGIAKAPIHNIQLAMQTELNSSLQGGFFFRYETGSAQQIEKFPNTGYEETRNYKLSSFKTGLLAAYSLTETYQIVLGLGVALTQSVVDSVATTAPVPSSLQPGTTKSLPLGLGYFAAVRYVFNSSQYSLDLGTSGSDSNEAIQQVFLAGIYKF